MEEILNQLNIIINCYIHNNKSEFYFLNFGIDVNIFL